jgi:hypothetical protein
MAKKKKKKAIPTNTLGEKRVIIFVGENEEDIVDIQEDLDEIRLRVISDLDGTMTTLSLSFDEAKKVASGLISVLRYIRDQETGS